MTDDGEGRDNLDVSVSIKAQNPDLETAWHTIAWWEQTCGYWYGQAQEGYAIRDSLPTHVAAARAEERERWEGEVRSLADSQQQAGDRLIEKNQNRQSPASQQRWSEGYALRRSAVAIRALLPAPESRDGATT